MAQGTFAKTGRMVYDGKHMQERRADLTTIWNWQERFCTFDMQKQAKVRRLPGCGTRQGRYGRQAYGWGHWEKGTNGILNTVFMQKRRLGKSKGTFPLKEDG